MKNVWIFLGVIFAIILVWAAYQKWNKNGKWYCANGNYNFKIGKCIEVTPTSATLTVVK